MHMYSELPLPFHAIGAQSNLLFLRSFHFVVQYQRVAFSFSRLRAQQPSTVSMLSLLSAIPNENFCIIVAVVLYNYLYHHR